MIIPLNKSWSHWQKQTYNTIKDQRERAGRSSEMMKGIQEKDLRGIGRKKIEFEQEVKNKVGRSGVS